MADKSEKRLLIERLGEKGKRAAFQRGGPNRGLFAGRSSRLLSCCLQWTPQGKGRAGSEAPRLSIEDAINKLFDERRQHALSIASSLLPCPITDTPVLYPYDQIRLCMLFNLNGAAITFCGILVEFALKHATYIKENPGATGFDTSALGQFEEITLGPAITRAKNAGLIDERLKKALLSL